jgi:hypothetical protein
VKRPKKGENAEKRQQHSAAAAYRIVHPCCVKHIILLGTAQSGRRSKEHFDQIRTSACFFAPEKRPSRFCGFSPPALESQGRPEIKSKSLKRAWPFAQNGQPFHWRKPGQTMQANQRLFQYSAPAQTRGSNASLELPNGVGDDAQAALPAFWRPAADRSLSNATKCMLKLEGKLKHAAMHALTQNQHFDCHSIHKRVN